MWQLSRKKTLADLLVVDPDTLTDTGSFRYALMQFAVIRVLS